MNATIEKGLSETRLADIKERVAAEQTATATGQTFQCRFILREGMAGSVIGKGWQYRAEELTRYCEVVILDPRSGECHTIANIYTGQPGVIGAALSARSCGRSTITLTAEQLEAVKACVERNSNNGMQISRHNARISAGWGPADEDDAGDLLKTLERDDDYAVT